MGRMRFSIPQPDRVNADALPCAYFAGMEGIPWPSNNSCSEGELIIDRLIQESGNLFLPWPVEHDGRLMLSTASLMERDGPYALPVELARGCLNRLRNQTADWKTEGLVVPESIYRRISEAMEQFTQAAIQKHSNKNASSEAAQQCIQMCVGGAEDLSGAYAAQVLALRHKNETQLSTLLGCALGQGTLPDHIGAAFVEGFNAVSLQFNWRDIEPNAGEFNWEPVEQQLEWCRSNGLKVCGGPLFQLDSASLPDWLYLWENDFETLRSYLHQFLAEAAKRFEGRLHVWHCAAGLNYGGALSLSEEQRLRLAVTSIEAVRSVDPRTPVFISFDQPWGEYLAKTDSDLSPLHFADALVRAEELGVAGIGMEINLGYWPGGTPPRELLDIHRQIERWGYLGHPLLILLTSPSSAVDDPQAYGSAKPLPKAYPNGPTAESQAEYLEKLLPMLIAKPHVHGVIWNQLRDAVPHRFPHGGLFDAEDQPKEALRVLTELRQLHLT